MCDAGEYWEVVMGMCFPCDDICDVLRTDTMRECRVKCPDWFCDVTCPDLHTPDCTGCLYTTSPTTYTTTLG